MMARFFYCSWRGHWSRGDTKGWWSWRTLAKLLENGKMKFRVNRFKTFKNANFQMIYRTVWVDGVNQAESFEILKSSNFLELALADSVSLLS